MPAGWLALNIARIEAGTPIFNLDFGTSSLPAETGVLDDRVSFTKGCYLGQEIVARMHARGHPKQVLVAIAFASVLEPAGGLPRLPETGAALSLAGATEVIGQVTSSTLSPLRASSPIGFAMVRYAHRAAGTVLTTVVEGVEVKGVIQEGLSFRAGASRGG
jgi:folate-binding protein YgfZ